MKGKAKVIQFTHERLLEVLDYNPDTGGFVWKKPPSRGVRAGSEAGRGRGSGSYCYVAVDKEEVTTSRLAWFYVHGEWPERRVRFINRDRTDCRIANLTMFNGIGGEYDHKTREGRLAYHKRYRQASPDVVKSQALRTAFGIDLAEYSQMLLGQDGKCAICAQPETQMRGGKVKALSVDHNHSTGAIRGLLCSDCNTGIGKLKDDRSVLLAAIRYLDKHASNVVPLDPSQGLMHNTTSASAT